jgi:ribosomal protein L34
VELDTGYSFKVPSIAWKEVCSVPTALESDACSQRSPDLASALQIRVRKDTAEMKLKIRQSGLKRRRLSGFRSRRRSRSGRRIIAGQRRRRK